MGSSPRRSAGRLAACDALHAGLPTREGGDERYLQAAGLGGCSPLSLLSLCARLQFEWLPEALASAMPTVRRAANAAADLAMNLFEASKQQAQIIADAERRGGGRGGGHGEGAHSG